MENLVDLVQSIIDKIDLEIKVNSVVGVRANVCNTLFLTKLKVVTIDGLLYTVTDFSLNEWLEVAPSGHSTPIPADTTTITAPDITFLQGAPMSANTEFKQLSLNVGDKTPFIWLVEPYSYDEQPFDSAVDVEFKGKLLFLDWAKSVWLNKDHNDLVIKPMNNLKESFVDAINEDFNFKRLENTKSVVRTRFGVLQDNKGPKKLILEEELSGVEFDLDLKVYDIKQCCSSTEIPLNTYVTVKNTDDSYNKTVTNGGSLVVPDTTQVIKDSAGATLYSNDIPSTTLEEQTINDSVVSNSDNSYIENVKAEDTLALPDIINVDSDGSNIPTTAQTPFISTLCPVATGIVYQRPQISGLQTSYRVGDDGWNLAAGTYNYTPPEFPVSVARLDLSSSPAFHYLVENNAFGNKDRFTDIDGLQVYGDSYIIDHLTGLGWGRGALTLGSWNTVIDTCNALSYVGFDDWRLLNVKELMSIYNSAFSSVLNYTPFSFGTNIITSSTRVGNVAQIHYLSQNAGVITPTNKTSTLYGLPVRNHFN